MEIQPTPRTEIAPADDNPQPISIRKLDRLETTHQSMNGGS
jgi:hypothetical protein